MMLHQQLRDNQEANSPNDSPKVLKHKKQSPGKALFKKLTGNCWGPFDALVVLSVWPCLTHMMAGPGFIQAAWGLTNGEQCWALSVPILYNSKVKNWRLEWHWSINRRGDKEVRKVVANGPSVAELKRCLYYLNNLFKSWFFLHLGLYICIHNLCEFLLKVFLGGGMFQFGGHLTPFCMVTLSGLLWQSAPYWF